MLSAPVRLWDVELGTLFTPSTQCAGCERAADSVSCSCSACGLTRADTVEIEALPTPSTHCAGCECTSTQWCTEAAETVTAREVVEMVSAATRVVETEAAATEAAERMAEREVVEMGAVAMDVAARATAVAAAAERAAAVTEAASKAAAKGAVETEAAEREAAKEVVERVAARVAAREVAEMEAVVVVDLPGADAVVRWFELELEDGVTLSSGIRRLYICICKRRYRYRYRFIDIDIDIDRYRYRYRYRCVYVYVCIYIYRVNPRWFELELEYGVTLSSGTLHC